MSRHEHGHASLLQAFSSLTLELQRLAQHKDIEHFHGHALNRIGQLLPFDSAWWGRAALIDGLPEEHSSYLHHLPPATCRTGNRSSTSTSPSAGSMPTRAGR